MNAENIQVLQSSTICHKVVDLFVDKLRLTVQVPRNLCSNSSSMTISLTESETLRHVHIPHISGLISKKNPAVQETSFNHGTDNIRIRRLEVTNQSKMQTEKVQNLQVDSLSNISMG